MEIEAKIILDEKEYSEIEKRFEYAEEIIRDDFYYRKGDQKELIRIRKTEKGCYLTIKRKEIKDGIEYNDERETEVKTPSVLEDIMILWGLECYFTKHTLSKKMKLKTMGEDVVAELKNVNGIKALEIEVVTQSKETIEKANMILDASFQKFGIENYQEKAEEKDWKQLIEEAKC